MTALAETQLKQLSQKRIFSTWWPLAMSWLFMSLELPALSAVIARLEDPEIHLAAYGGVVFPLALIIEAPVIMLLAASTALSKDWPSYLKLRNYMIAAGVTLTALHIAIAFTPLYYVVVEGIIGAPPEIVEPARIGLMIITSMDLGHRLSAVQPGCTHPFWTSARRQHRYIYPSGCKYQCSPHWIFNRHPPRNCSCDQCGGCQCCRRSSVCGYAHQASDPRSTQARTPRRPALNLPGFCQFLYSTCANIPTHTDCTTAWQRSAQPDATGSRIASGLDGAHRINFHATQSGNRLQ